MVVALADNQHIALKVLAQHIPGVITGTLQPTDAQPLALADGVIHEAVVAADDITFGGFNVAGLSRQVALEEVGEAPLADEADTGRVLLACRGQFILLGNAPDFGFFQLANRKQGPCQLVPGNGMQEIALILVAIQATQQQRLSVAVSPARVMTRRNQVGAQHQRIIQEGLELDFPVAQDVRVGRAPRLVLLEKVLKNIVPVLGGEVCGVQLDAEAIGDGLGVGQVFPGSTVLGAIVLVPVLHEQSLDLIALLDQQGRRDGRVDTAGHADNDPGVAGRLGLDVHISESGPVGNSVCSDSRADIAIPEGCAAVPDGHESRPA